MADQIYTYIGEILIACNPCKELGIYSDGAKLLYQDAKKDSLPPHVFMIASNTYQSMIQKRNDQVKNNSHEIDVAINIKSSPIPNAQSLVFVCQ